MEIYLVVCAICLLNHWSHNISNFAPTFFCLPSDGISKFVICYNFFRTLQLRRAIRRLKLQDFPPGGTLFACWDHEFKNCLIRFITICCYSYSWFTNLEKMPLNCSQQLLAPYKWLIDRTKQK